MSFNISALVQSIRFRIAYFLILALGGFWISPLWPVFLAVWLFISLFWSYTKQVEVLSEVEKRVYHISLYFYPILGTFIKIYIFVDWFPNTYFWVNRFEHALWAMVLVVLMLPFWKRLWVGLRGLPRYARNDNTIALFITIVGVICLFGNMVEFVEYGFRLLGGYQYKYALYYPDTMFDMISNIVGATAGFLVVAFLTKK